MSGFCLGSFPLCTGSCPVVVGCVFAQETVSSCVVVGGSQSMVLVVLEDCSVAVVVVVVV